MKCPLCAGDMEKGFTTLTFTQGSEETIVIQNVPADVCTQCGESFVDFETTRRVEQIIQSVKRNGLKVGVLVYGEAA